MVLIQITRKASRKSNIDEIVFIQNHPNGQKMLAKCWLVQIEHFFRIHIKQYSHFQRVTTKQEYTHFQSLYQTDTLRELLQTILHTFPNIKQYWHFQRVTGNQYYTVFQSLRQTILTFSESYWQTILHTFQVFILSNTDIFREFLSN